MQAIIFDLDGTIVFSHPTHFAAYEKLFADFGISWTYDEFNNLFAGTGAPAIIKMMLERHGIKNADYPALVRKKRDIFQKLLDRRRLETVNGFFDFLKKVNESGLKKAIASGSNRQNIIGMLKNIGVLKDFPQIISGEDVKNPKPAPDIFLEVARKINVQPQECLVIEDTDHGVAGAKAAQMKCIGLSTTIEYERLKNAGADAIFKDYTEIEIAFCRSLFNKLE